MNVQAPPNLAPDALELLLRSGRQRLGRRLAADRRLHQPRGAVAEAAPSCAGAPRPPAQRSSSACPSTRSTLARPGVLRAARARGARCARVGADGYAPPTPRAREATPGGRMSLERLLADVDPPRGAASSTARSTAASSACAGRRARCSRARGADLHALLRAADLARARRQGRRRLVRRLPQHELHERLLRRLHVLRLLAPPRRRRRLRPPDGDAAREGDATRSRAAPPRSASRAASIPKKDHAHYREILIALKREFPKLHIHAFSPEEIDFGQRKSGMPLAEYLRWLVDAGLGTIPGTAAEILDDEIREVISPNKLAARSLGRDRHDGARDRAALDLDRDVRPHRDAAATWRATSTLLREHPEAHRRLHRVRAARLHPREEHAVQPHARAAGRVDERGPAY